MAFFSIQEVLELAVMTLALGYIFTGYVQQPVTEYSVRHKKGFFDREDFKLALLISAPAVVLHELAHKFAALALGLSATFHTSLWGLGIGVFLKLIHSPFILFIPGYVAISGASSPFMSALTGLAGPLTNLALFSIATWILNNKKSLTRQQAIILHLTKQINLFLFLFNMIPLPPFDGYHVVSGILKTLF